MLQVSKHDEGMEKNKTKPETKTTVEIKTKMQANHLYFKKKKLIGHVKQLSIAI